MNCFRSLFRSGTVSNIVSGVVVGVGLGNTHFRSSPGPLLGSGLGVIFQELFQELV